MKSAMTSSPLRVAIIGAGQVADKVHASYYCTRNDLELVAVCDSRLSQAQALAEKYGNASVWDDPQAMLLAVKPDVVSVCSPTSSSNWWRRCINPQKQGRVWNYDQASNVIRTPFQPAYPEQVCIADGAGERLSWASRQP